MLRAFIEHASGLLVLGALAWGLYWLHRGWHEVKWELKDWLLQRRLDAKTDWAGERW